MGYCSDDSESGSWRDIVAFKQTNNHPVVCVNWDDASAYTNWLSTKTGHEYRLLSEAEWEYAARAGTNTAYHFGRVISGHAQYDSQGTTAVGSFAANAFGLHDMHGNVDEWVQDCWHLDYTNAPTDGSAWLSFCEGEHSRTRRGGAWDDRPGRLRSAARIWFDATVRVDWVGFRVARTLTFSDSSSSSKTIDRRKDLLTTADTPQAETSPSSVVFAYKYASGIGNNDLMEVKATLEEVRDLSDDDQIIEKLDGAIQKLQRIIDLKDFKIPVNTPDTANLIEDISELTYSYEVGKTFRDCATCPAMVVLPAGEFIMGSPEGETGRDDDEGPQRQVTIPNPFAVGKYEVTIAQFVEFIEETKHEIGDCSLIEGRSWNNPGFKQTDNHPAVCVSWHDASTYADWLSTKTGHGYRLLTEAEWEYAARAGTTTAYHFGRVISSNQAQYASEGTVAVGSFAANAFGLHDMHGNVWEWVQDCWHPDYKKAPTDGSAWLNFCIQNDRFRMLRGGSGANEPLLLRSAARGGVSAAFRGNDGGFRVARTLNP